jgi:DNA-directed RNA polymerase subunit L
MEIGELIVTDIPVRAPKDLAHLVPKRTKYSAELALRNCRNTIPNALRRTIMSELDIVGFIVNYTDIDTNDKHLFDMLDLLIQRFKMVPVDQKTPLTCMFQLDVANDMETTRDVIAGDMKQIAGTRLDHLPCEHNIPLFTLQPNRYFRCTIRVNELYNSERTNGGRAVASGVRSVLENPDDAYNQHTGTGTHVMTSDHRNWVLRFDTNGTMAPHEIIVAACNKILARLRGIVEVVQDKLMTVGQEYHITFADSGTIGELIAQAIYFNQTDVDAVFLAKDDKANTVTLRLKTKENASEIINGGVELLINDFTNIKQKFAAPTHTRVIAKK